MRRVRIAFVAAIVVVAGLGVHLFAPGGFASDAVGDALYAILVFLLVALLAPRRSPWALGSIAVGWCVVVELFQLTGLPASWGFPLTLVFGSGFAATDLVFYALGVALAAGVSVAFPRRTAPANSSRGDEP